MNAPHFHRTPDLRTALDIAHARKLAQAANELADILERNGRWSIASEWAGLELCNAGIAMFDDGDFMVQREVFATELGVDEEGYPDGEPRDPDQFWRDSIHAINGGLSDGE